MSQVNPPLSDTSATPTNPNWTVPAIPWAVALLAYLGAVVFLPKMDGCACFTRWHLLPFVLVAFAVAAAAYFQRRFVVPEGNNPPMPGAARLALTLYLLVFGICLVFMLVSLTSLDFPETPVMPQRPEIVPAAPAAAVPATTVGNQNAAPQNSPAPATPGAPAGQAQPRINAAATATPAPAPFLRQAFPQSTIGSSPTLSLTLYGDNFTQESKVRFGSIPVKSEFISPNLITADLQPSHLANVGAMTVDVANSPTLISNALIVPIVKPAVKVNVFFCWWPVITREAQLLLLVIFAGALGSYLHAIMSLADYIGNRDLKASWFWWYVSRPFLGMAMALVFYAVVRGGFLAGTPADANVVNPFGVLAIGALVGMFSDKAAMKLKDVFDVVFTAKDERKDKLSAKLEIKQPAGGSLSEAVAGLPYECKVEATGGTPPYKWSLTDGPSWLVIDPATGILTGQPTDEDGPEVTVIVKVEDAANGAAEATLSLKVLMETSPP
jgi:hypothetical protein